MAASTIITSSELRRRPSAARRATCAGPVIITERGKPSHVLVSIDQYRRLAHAAGSEVQEPMGLNPRADFE